MFLVIMFITACSAFDNNDDANNFSDPSYQRLSNETRDNDAPNVKQNSGENDVAKDLVTLSNKVKGVKGATAVVSGMYSVVGITFDEKLSAKQKEQVKNNVYQALGTHPRGANTLIATKASDIQKLKKMRERMNNTKVASGVYEDLGRLISTLEPNETNPSRSAYPSEQDLKNSRIQDNTR